ncbi:MAG TPA: response regulator [Candidatus Thermoplasmatota archaeon]|nr:response regulator [Candidatus Thermoplasmatota archaeon]
MEKSIAQPIRMLIVEDNEDHSTLLQRAFRGKRFEIDVAINGSDAIALLREPYDIVLLDYKLPDMDGLELLDKIRERDPNAAVVFITGEGNEEVAMRALSHGALDYVTKRAGYDVVISEVVEEALQKVADLRGTETMPNREALERVLANLRLGGVVKAMMVLSFNGKALAFKLPKSVNPDVSAVALGRLRTEAEALSGHFKSGLIYVHLRFGALGVLLEPVGKRAVLATFIDPPEAVASARVLTRQAIEAILAAWSGGPSPPRSDKDRDRDKKDYGMPGAP